MNFLTVINESAYLIVLNFFLVLQLMNNKLSAKTKYVNFGYPMMILIGITMLVNMVVCIISVFISFKEAWQNYKKKKNQKLIAKTQKVDMDESSIVGLTDKISKVTKKKIVSLHQSKMKINRT
jgi:predicted membrane protein